MTVKASQHLWNARKYWGGAHWRTRAYAVHLSQEPYSACGLWESPLTQTLGPRKFYHGPYAIQGWEKQLTTIRKEYITVDLILAVSFHVQQVNATVDLYVCVLLVVQRTVSTEAQLGTSTFYQSDWQVRHHDVVDSNCSGHRPPDDVTRRDVTSHSGQQSSTVQQQGLPGWWWWCCMW